MGVNTVGKSASGSGWVSKLVSALYTRYRCRIDIHTYPLILKFSLLDVSRYPCKQRDPYLLRFATHHYLQPYPAHPHASSLGHNNSLVHKHHPITPKTHIQTRINKHAMTHPKIFNPSLSSAFPRAKVAVTRAVLGKTKLHQVMRKGMAARRRRRYLWREPTEIVKNQRERP